MSPQKNWFFENRKSQSRAVYIKKQGTDNEERECQIGNSNSYFTADGAAGLMQR
jgi:hypothetical protein